VRREVQERSQRLLVGVDLEHHGEPSRLVPAVLVGKRFPRLDGLHHLHPKGKAEQHHHRLLVGPVTLQRYSHAVL
jgi:hypothetical protein